MTAAQCRPDDPLPYSARNCCSAGDASQVVVRSRARSERRFRLALLRCSLGATGSRSGTHRMTSSHVCTTTQMMGFVKLPTAPR